MGRASIKENLMFNDVKSNYKELSKRCIDLRNVISYFPNKGFSYCCNECSNKFSYDSLSEMKSSYFFTNIYQMKFSEMLKRIDHTKEYFDVCEICAEYCKGLSYEQ